MVQRIEQSKQTQSIFRDCSASPGGEVREPAVALEVEGPQGQEVSIEVERGQGQQEGGQEAAVPDAAPALQRGGPRRARLSGGGARPRVEDGGGQGPLHGGLHETPWLQVRDNDESTYLKVIYESALED